MSLRLQVSPRPVVSFDADNNVTSDRDSSSAGSGNQPSANQDRLHFPITPGSPRPFPFISIMDMCWVCPSCIERRQNRKRRKASASSLRSPVKTLKAGVCSRCGLPSDSSSVCQDCARQQKGLVLDMNNPNLVNGYNTLHYNQTNGVSFLGEL